MRKTIFPLILLSFSSYSNAQDSIQASGQIHHLEEVIVSPDATVGSKFKAKNIAGSTYYISPKELKQFNYGDINRILQSVPGVTVVDEEGFGHRPNIGLRGTSPTNTAKITLMEDGVLIAPAPYTAPAAYYFPTVNRIQAFEILKGSSQIQYGPFTTGGAINMISTQIPDDFKGRIRLNYGSFNTRNAYMNVGDSGENFGYVVEYNNRASDGFKRIDHSSKKTGFEGSDYMAKFRINTNANAKVYQSLTLKAQYSKENADETYLGLTDTDFKNNYRRRYLASEADNIGTEHFQLMLTHFIKPAQNITITTKAYNNNFRRNWYKLNDVRYEGKNYSLKEILNDPLKNSAAYELLTGDMDGSDNSLRYRANNRKYNAKGIQTVANIKFNGQNTTHDLDVGIRYHKDSEDRFQWNDGYAIRNNNLYKTSSGAPGSQDNRVAETNAFAAHVLYNFGYKNLRITPGIRYENINIKNTNYGTSDLGRNGSDALRLSENKVDVFIPGISALYAFSKDLSVFSSLHKGFSPPGTSPGQKAEESLNFEVGTRGSIKGLSGEVIYFNNNYRNMLGSDANAAGGTGQGDLFNAGKASVSGLEVLLSYNPLFENSTTKLPISFSYTYTSTELKSNFSSRVEAWGNVSVGDEIPYIPKNQWAMSVGLEHKRLSIYVNSRYNGQFRTQAGQGAIPEQDLVKRFFVMDFATNYQISRRFTLSCNLLNVLNNKYAVSRVPSGLRPGLPFAANAGASFDF
ncbi:TonB-dependent receptor [Chryseobacterium piperi]|uniref:TonB-dependent receptor n=1 Tax=Chryseobacterium piperi TaxID=558152 RepID=A0A086BMP8_9FLAO|nr:TonB-dependent receptor [Chryseobacterium piperi]ASW75004.1 TonB-dependent receptor [Chryseobacterium piperi]KFF30212.1 TonB-dependent receptor [Chryseobacterium piperi]